MKNIEIVVNASGDCDIKSIETQLLKMYNELKDTQAQVSFYTSSDIKSQSLKNLQLPFTELFKDNVFNEGNNLNSFIYSKLKTNPDILVFIGDCVEESLHSSTFEMVDKTQILIVQSKYKAFSHTPDLDSQVLKNFVSEISHLPFVKCTDVERYTSLEKLLHSKPGIQGNIKNIRMTISQDNIFEKIKP